MDDEPYWVMWVNMATERLNLDQDTHFLSSRYTLFFSSTTLPAALCFTICAFGQAKEQLNSEVSRPATNIDLTMDEIILNNAHMRINLVWRIEK